MITDQEIEDASRDIARKILPPNILTIEEYYLDLTIAAEDGIRWAMDQQSHKPGVEQYENEKNDNTGTNRASRRGVC